MGHVRTLQERRARPSRPPEHPTGTHKALRSSAEMCRSDFGRRSGREASKNSSGTLVFICATELAAIGTPELQGVQPIVYGNSMTSTQENRTMLFLVVQEGAPSFPDDAAVSVD